MAATGLIRLGVKLLPRRVLRAAALSNPQFIYQVNHRHHQHRWLSSTRDEDFAADPEQLHIVGTACQDESKEETASDDDLLTPQDNLELLYAHTSLDYGSDAYRTSMVNRLMRWESLPAFEDIPYNVDENLWNNLILTLSLQLRDTNLSSRLSIKDPIVMWSTNPDAQGVQEALAEAAAHYFKANYLPIDDCLLPDIAESMDEEFNQQGGGSRQAPVERQPRHQYMTFRSAFQSIFAALDGTSNARAKLLDFQGLAEGDEQPKVMRLHEATPSILLIRNGGQIMSSSACFKAVIKALKEARKRGPVAVIGTHTHLPVREASMNSPLDLLKRLTGQKERNEQAPLFGNQHLQSQCTPIEVSKKIDDPEWLSQLRVDRGDLKVRANHQKLAKAVEKSSVKFNFCGVAEIDGLEELDLNQADADQIVGWAVSTSQIEAIENSNNPEDAEFTVKHLQQAVSMFSERQGSQSVVESTADTGLVLTEEEEELSQYLIKAGQMDVKFENVGALTEVKEALYDLITLPLEQRELFSKGLLAQSVRGILLFGPPGTGKTLLAKAVARESGCNMLHVSRSTVFSKWLGDSEKKAQAVFSLARKVAPCVIFFDEMESMFTHRGSGGPGMKYDNNVMSEILAQWDGLKTSSDRVIVLGATNRPFDIDDAVLRRLPRRLLVDMPDKQARRAVFEVTLRDEKLNTDVDLDGLADKTEGYSGSDIYNLCLMAAMESAKDTISSKATKKKHLGLYMKHFDASFGKVKKSVQGDQKDLHKWAAEYADGEDSAAEKRLGFQ